MRVPAPVIRRASQTLNKKSLQQHQGRAYIQADVKAAPAGREPAPGLPHRAQELQRAVPVSARGVGRQRLVVRTPGEQGPRVLRRGGGGHTQQCRLAPPGPLERGHRLSPLALADEVLQVPRELRGCHGPLAW